MSKNCGECQALTMLLENNLISDDAYVSDCPDIRSLTENVEVTSAIPNDEVGRFENQLNFGIIKEKQYIKLQEYNCDNCEFLQDCKEDFKCGYSLCRKCKGKNALLMSANNSLITYGEVLYANQEHPEPICYPVDFYGSQKDIENAIKRKEGLSIKYSIQTTGLFLFYDKEIQKIEPIKSNIFKNIYIYCIFSGNLYKNWKLIKHYRRGGDTLCYNTKCDEYGKFNN